MLNRKNSCGVNDVLDERKHVLTLPQNQPCRNRFLVDAQFVSKNRVTLEGLTSLYKYRLTVPIQVTLVYKVHSRW